MAKESVKARQRKREVMVARYAEKRAALKAAGDYKALDLLPKSGQFQVSELCRQLFACVVRAKEHSALELVVDAKVDKEEPFVALAGMHDLSG